MKLKLDDDDLDILKDFITESEEYVKNIEDNILLLEDQQNEEVINNIFRQMHSIKGTSGFLNLNQVKLLSHEAEYLLDDIRNEKLSVTPAITQALLDTTDMLKTMFAEVKQAWISPVKQPDGVNILEVEDSAYEPLVASIKTLKEQKELPPEEIKPEPLEIEVPHLDRDVALRFSQTCISDMEILKAALRDIAATKKEGPINKSIINRFHAHCNNLQKAGDEIKFSVFAAKIAELKNMFRFLVESEADMTETFMVGIKGNISAVEVLIKQPELKAAAPQRDKNIKTRATDVDISVIRVPGERLDKFMNKIGELVVSKNIFDALGEELSTAYKIPEMSKKLKDAGNIIKRITDDLQAGIMEIRMMPVKEVFSRFNRMVYDLAKKTGKPLKLTMEGEDTELDKTVIEKIGDPLVHMIRNSADHGIESPEERKQKGKSKTGTIHLSAYNQGQQVEIKVKDDGKGLSAKNIGEKAVKRGLITQKQLETMDETAILQLIMAPGFSMAAKVTEISGRGVGMDVVKSNIEKLGGTVTLESQVDQGTTVTMSIPLTLAVSRGLLIEAANDLFILPLENVVETIKTFPQQIRKFKNKKMLAHRDSVLRIVPLKEILQINNHSNKNNPANVSDTVSLVILRAASEIVALEVDRFHKEVDIMIKPLEGQLGQINGITGATIQSDGRVVLVINPAELIK